MKQTKGYKPHPGTSDGAYVQLADKKGVKLHHAVRYRVNRYSLCGDDVRMIPVQFGWKRVTFAEMRDLNRHRTGQKRAILHPNGFYDAHDETRDRGMRQRLKSLAQRGEAKITAMRGLLRSGDQRYFYHSLLGHTYQFSHTTTLDKFIYEAELRTGVGAHYRYAMHLRNCLRILYKRHPELKGLLFEGSAEPE